MQPLNEGFISVLSGKWTDKNNGGSHLFDKQFTQDADKQTWVNNPKFILKF